MTSENNTTNGIPIEAIICLFVFIAILIGSVFRQLYKTLSIPYTPALMIFGIILGVLATRLGIFGESLILSTHIDPHGILMVFLPTLLFESAMSVDWYVFKKSFPNILLLAGPGVFVSIMLIGVCLKVIIRYGDEDVSWVAAFTLGSIISTTDPVAVVALLKSIGAPIHFSTLIEGESLFNDGSAIVFYELFVSMTKGEHSSAGSIVLRFISLACGSPILGLAFGVVGCLWLRRIIRDSIMITSLTFCMCYLCYFTAEYAGLHLSGILATVALGIFMAVFGKIRIDYRTEEFLHAVWRFAQYAAETMIFLIAGVEIGYYQFFSSDTTIGVGDWFRMIALYVCINFVRLIMIIIFYPCLSRIGYKLNWREAIVLCYGGFRGAVSLALALLLRSEEKIPIRARELIIFNTVGMATLTMLINATTCKFLIKALKMVHVSAAKTEIKRNFLVELRNDTKKKLEEIRQYKYHELCDWERVVTFVGLGDKESAEFEKKICKETEKVLTIDHDMLAEARFRFLRVIRKMFWEKYEQGQLSKNAIALLLDSCARGLDEYSTPIRIWEFLYSYFLKRRGRRIMFKLTKWPLIGKLAESYTAGYLSLIYQTTTTLIMVFESLIDYKPNFVLIPSHFKKIKSELKMNIYEANNYLISIQDEFTDIIRTVQVRRTAGHLLHFQLASVEKAMEEEQIDKIEGLEIQRQLDKKTMKIEKIKVHETVPMFDQFVVRFPAFSVLTREQMKEFQTLAQNQYFAKGEELYTRGKVTDSFYILTKGTTKAFRPREHNEEREVGENDEIYMLRGIGGLLSLLNIVEQRHCPLYTCVAESAVIAKRLPMDFLDKLLKENREFEEFCYRNALPAAVKSPDTQCEELTTLDDQTLLEYAKDAKVLSAIAGKHITLKFGGVLFRGTVTELINEPGDTFSRKFYNPISYIPKSHGTLVATDRVKILAFNRNVGEFSQERGYISPLHLQPEDVEEPQGVSKSFYLKKSLMSSQPVSKLDCRRLSTDIRNIDLD